MRDHRVQDELQPWGLVQKKLSVVVTLIWTPQSPLQETSPYFQKCWGHAPANAIGSMMQRKGQGTLILSVITKNGWGNRLDVLPTNRHTCLQMHIKWVAVNKWWSQKTQILGKVDLQLFETFILFLLQHQMLNFFFHFCHSIIQHYSDI